MEIERKQQGDSAEVKISGRLDAHWSDQLDRELAEVVRAGALRIDLDMAGIEYISSAGIRILMKSWKELQAINGRFRIVSLSANVRKVLKMSGMLDLFGENRGTEENRDLPAPEPLREAGGRFTVFPADPLAKLSLRLVGRPERLAEACFGSVDVTTLFLPPDALAVGVGAFGADFAECRSRFGEFLALGGATLCLPADASGTPDDQVALGAFVPTVQALYALVCQGAFAHFFNFAPAEPGSAPFPLSRLVERAFSLCGTPLLAMALIAEADGLVGAQLRRPPVAKDRASVFAFPEVRDWFSLTTERAYPRTLTLVAGIAARGDHPELAPYLRPLGGGTELTGHFHAAALSYRALPGGLLELPKTVADLMETQSLLGVLHLLDDQREISGIGESLFIRGAAWAGPLEFTPEKGEKEDRG
ncbi:MAG: STAS domain-containing protein [Deltaproteobacteria bacterium]|nr:STAS domain-containing protein [Deltaproteobacteria bacterium]